jgi:hypothetical protein
MRVVYFPRNTEEPRMEFELNEVFRECLSDEGREDGLHFLLRTRM